MKLRTLTTLAMASVAMSVLPAFSQDVHISQNGLPERIFRPILGLNQNDINFLHQAAVINMFEIESSKVAREKNSSPFVAEFAKEMITDHEGSLEELKTIAANKGVNLPSSLPKDLERKLMHLENLTGTNFDMTYENAQRSGHAAASGKFKMEIENGKDADVKGYAVKTLPTVLMHYRMMLSGQTEMGSTKMSHGN